MTDKFADMLVRTMQRHKFEMATGPGQVNIIYVEGMDPDGSANGNRPDKWNDLRSVVMYRDGEPYVAGLWTATTEPGRYYDVEHVINSKGCARIALGQQTCWQVGLHRGRLALVQTGDEVTVLRDLNKDFRRDGDEEDTGYFGINQHDGQNGDPSSVGVHSAGCLVVRDWAQHLQFMALVQADPRYREDHEFVFPTTVLEAADVLAVPAPAPTPVVAKAAAASPPVRVQQPPRETK